MRSQQSKNSFAEDEFEHPQGGPVGLHRGSRSAAARLTPYIVALLIAVLCGVLAYLWLAGTGDTSKLFASSSTSQTQSKSTSKSASNSEKTQSDSTKSTGSSSSNADSSNASKDESSTQESSSTESSQSSQQNQTNSNNTQNSTQQNENQEPNHALAVAVVNGTGRTGYAATKASTLTSAGYTAMTPQNPTDRSTLPNADVVWYANASDQATAQDIAKQLGITQVVQVQGIATPVTVVLMQ